MQYKDKLNLLNVKELKAFIRGYNLQTKIVMTKKKKEDLIIEILKHTDYINGKIIIKSHPIEGSVEAKPKVIKTKVVKPKKEGMKSKPIMKTETMKEMVKEEPIKEYEKDKLTFLEFMEPLNNKVDDDMISNNKKIILDNFGDELDKIIDVDKYNSIIDNIPDLGDVLNKIIMWLDKKQGSKDYKVAEYRTLVKSVIYNLFLKKQLDKMKVNMFNGIVISNMVASDPILKQYYDNNTKYSIIRTFIESKPLIPKNQLTPILQKLTTDYFMSSQK